MVKRERDADVIVRNDQIKQPRKDTGADKESPESVQSLQCRAATAYHALQGAQASHASDLQPITPPLRVLTEAVLEDCLTAATIAGMLGELDRILINLPAELHTTRATQVQEFAAQLLQLLEACHKHVAKWEDVPGAPRLFFASTLWIVKADTPAMRLATDSTPPSGLCTAALRLLCAVHEHCWFFHGDFEENVSFDPEDRLVVDVVMDVLKQGSDADARSAAGGLLKCMTCGCAAPFVGRLLEWGTVASLVDAIIGGSPHSLNTDIVHALGNVCSCHSGPIQFVALQEALCGLIPVLVAMVMVQPAAAGAHVRLLHIVCKEILDDNDSECVEAGTVPAAVAYMRAIHEHGTRDDGGLHDAAELLARLSVKRPSVIPMISCGGAQTLVSCLTRADPNCFKDIVVCLGNTVANVVNFGGKLQEAVTRSCCLKEAVLCQVKRRQLQLKHEPALVEDCRIQRAVDALNENVDELMDYEVGLEDLAFFTRAETARAACYLMEHVPEERLRSMLLNWRMLCLLCGTLTDNEACKPAHVPCWHHWRASAWALHALMDRLLRARDALAGNPWDPSSHAPGGQQLATGAAPQGAGAAADDVIMHVAVPGSMLRGEQPWTFVKVVVEGRAFYVLQEVLCRASPVFRTMLEGSFRENGAPEIVLGEIGCGEWEVVLQHIYTGGADVPAALLEQVLAVAERFMLDGLKGACQELLIKKLDVSNAPQLFELSLKHCAELLQRHCMLLMLKHWAADGDFAATAASATVISVGHQAGEPSHEPSRTTQTSSLMGLPAGDQAASGGSAEEREARVDEELRGMVAAALLPCVQNLLDRG